MFISIYKFYFCVAHYVLLRMYHVYRVTLAKLFNEKKKRFENTVQGTIKRPMEFGRRRSGNRTK